MKKLVCCMALAAAATGIAAPKPLSQMTPEEKAAHMKLVQEKTGGFLDIESKGKIVVVNAQKRISADAVRKSATELGNVLKLTVDYTEGELAMYRVPDGATGALVVGDSADLPMSVVAAEKSWGLLNVAPLATDDAAKLDKRFRMEFIRVATFAFGQSLSQFTGSPLQTIKDAEGLDSVITDGYTYDTVTMMLKNLGALGMTQKRKTSYRRACMEGWAPAPTNDVQKKVWNEVLAMPDKPIKIQKKK